MPTLSPDWGIPLLYSNQANADVTVNTALRFLETIANYAIVKSKTTTAQPGSPADGDAYIIGSGATGSAWAGNDGKLAVNNGSTGSWVILAARQGMMIYATDTDTVYVKKAGGWVTVI